MSNIILIKRRVSGSAGAPTFLSGGELAFNEVNKTLYYGADAANGGVLAIGGEGTFATNTLVNTLTSDLQTQISNFNSGATTAIESLSTEVYSNFVEKVESEAVTLNGGLTVASGLTVDSINASGNVDVGGNLTVTGDLQVLGSVTTLETTTTVTSSFSIENAGGVTALVVNQTGMTDIAEFKDDGATALIIKDGGNVGIGTATPNEKLTVSGNVSASGEVYTSQLDLVGATSNASIREKDGLGVVIANSSGDQLLLGQFFSDSGVVARSGQPLALYGNSEIKLKGINGMGFPDTLTSAIIDATTTVATGALSAHGSLTVDGTSTFNDDVDVIDKVTVKTSNYVSGAAGGGIILDSANKKITVDDGFNSFSSELTPSGIGSVANTNGFTISTVADGGAGIKLNPASGSHTNIQQGNLVGTGTTELVDFVVDGGTF